MSNRIKANVNKDGVDRRGFLNCMAWAGTGMLWSVAGGVPSSKMFGQTSQGGGAAFSFVQISDSHIGFSKEANKDVGATLQQAIDKINALPEAPDFLIHTGDLTHLSKPSEFDTLDQLLRSAKVGQRFFVPGEHDVLSDNGQQYRERYGRGTQGQGWYSFDHKGVHFIGLVNVVDLKPGGLGALGEEQLRWLEKDVAGRSSSAPVVVFAHIPLWTVYPEWGWGTDDGARALSYLKRFGSVTVLNGHIHQTVQKTEGNMFFHTATSTAFPQPKPGTAPSPGPVTVPAPELVKLLGLTSVHYVPVNSTLGVVDMALASQPAEATKGDGTASSKSVNIDQFTFTPAAISLGTGGSVHWTNRDDIPHVVVSVDGKFVSPVLDTDQSFAYTFNSPGSYPYYCKIHPKMTGVVTVGRG